MELEVILQLVQTGGTVGVLLLVLWRLEQKFDKLLTLIIMLAQSEPVSQTTIKTVAERLNE